MEMTGITFEDFNDACRAVSIRYGRNVRMHADAKAVSSRSSRGRVEVLDSHGPGARRAWSGRHGRWACWHVYRDVLSELFDTNPEATIRTSLTVYKGARDFELIYPGTADKNIGSMMSPAYMPELCDCGPEIRGDDD